MLSWETVQKYRRRLLITAAAGTAGAVAAYYWYSYSGSTEPAADANTLGSSGQDTSIASAANTAAEDAQLQAHFEEMQSICSSTRIPTMVPLLMQHIERAADVDAIIRLLQEGKANGTIQDAHKFALWQELKVTSFTRAMAAAWCLPVVDLLLRCQLSVLGRHLYYAARTGGGHHSSPTPTQAPPIAVTPQLQQLFLDQASFAAQVGVNMVVSFMRHAVTQVVGTLDLKRALGCGQLEDTVGGVMEVYQGMVGGVGLAAVLLPSPEQMQANLASQRPPGTPAELAQSVEGNVAVLMDELRVVVASPLFAEAATAAVATVLGMQMQGLANTMAGGEVPLVKLLPMVARSADELAAQQQSIDARAFFYGRAFAQVLNERLGEVATDVLSEAGKFAAEWDDTVASFEQEVLRRAANAQAEATGQPVDGTASTTLPSTRQATSSKTQDVGMLVDELRADIAAARAALQRVKQASSSSS